MSDGKKRITKVKVILSVLLVAIVVAAVVTGYRYYQANRWIAVRDTPEGAVVAEVELVPVAVSGEPAQKNSAHWPWPQMILKQGKAKFLPNTTGKSEKHLGYKLTITAEMGKTERDISKYAPYLYQTRFRFTLVDKDGFPLQVVEGPKDYEIFEISKSRDYQNVCTTPVGDSTAERTSSVYVTYIISATGSHP